MTLTADFVSGQSIPFSRERQRIAETALQEGVLNASDLKAVQRGLGANMSVDIGLGAAWLQIDTGSRNGSSHIYNDATFNQAIGAADATNPRVDQVYLQYNDSGLGIGSGNVPTFGVLAGTATAGATLDNRTGAPALGNDRLLLADILVPATSTSVVTANIRDRRRWARGARYYAVRTGGAIAATTGSGLTAAQVVLGLLGTGQFGTQDLSLVPRMELSGVPLRMHLHCGVAQDAAAKTISINPVIESAGVWAEAHGATIPSPVGQNTWGTFNESVGASTGKRYDFARVVPAPAAGSHLVGWAINASNNTFSIDGSAASPIIVWFEEIVGSLTGANT